MPSDSFTIVWPYFLVAVALLCLPRQWLRTGRRVLKRRSRPDGALEQLAGMGARNSEDRSVHPGKEFKNFRNYVDLCRALVGSYCLGHFSFVVTGEVAARQVNWICSAILFVAVLIQSIRYDRKVSFFAAIFFLVGISVGSTAHYSSLFAFALVLAINPIIANPRMFLTAYGVFFLVFGLFFSDNYFMLGVNVVLALLVPLLSLLTKRPVVIFSRKRGAAA